MNQPHANAATPYSADFFAGQSEGSARSASVVLPIVLGLVKPKSVCDVGCGVGAWLSACAAAGITDIHGFDGDYVDRQALRFPEGNFTAVDLAAGFSMGRSFDLALCLEVGEHLPESSAEPLVKTLSEAAPVVLFSAAVPLQGGTGHVNERPQSWWSAMFERFGFVAVDIVRPQVWNDERVSWWYRQNMLLYVRKDRVEADDGLRDALLRTNAGMLDVVHPRLLAKRNEKPLRRFAGAAAWFRALRGAFGVG